jgi:hypothetical protein
VSDPSYLLNGIPAQLRQALAEEAQARDLSLADTMRSILCSHYALDCPPRGSGYNRRRDEGSQQMLLRVSPDLFAAIKEEAAEADLTMRQIILNVLEANLTEGASA